PRGPRTPAPPRAPARAGSRHRGAPPGACPRRRPRCSRSGRRCRSPRRALALDDNGEAVEAAPHRRGLRDPDPDPLGVALVEEDAGDRLGESLEEVVLPVLDDVADQLEATDVVESVLED